MEKLSKPQLICIKTLVRKLNIEDSDAIVLGCSAYRTSSVSELTPGEAALMIGELKKRDPDEVAADKMRKKMIGLCYEYHNLSATAARSEKQEAVKSLERWVLKYGHGGKSGRHKSFNSYTKDELPLLVSQFGTVYRDFIKKV